jgi:4'-phosphopantetheinyl transferase
MLARLQMPSGSEEVLLLLAVPEELLDASNRAHRLEVLSRADIEHGSRFRAALDRDVALASRIVQRLALTMATGDEVPPAAWRFVPGERGRPELASPPKRWSGLRFSAANTIGLVGCAVRMDRAVGLDLERRRDTLPAELLDRIFSERERAELLRLGERDRPERFMRLWTAKEAYLKARGVGIVDELDQVEIAIAPRARDAGANEECAGLSLGPDIGDDGNRWQLALLEPTRAHLAALCFERAPEAVSASIRQAWAPRSAERAPVARAG